MIREHGKSTRARSCTRRLQPLRESLEALLNSCSLGHWHPLGPGGGATCASAGRSPEPTSNFTGGPEKWELWGEIRKCNPLTNLPGEDGARFRKQLLKERNEAQQDSRNKASFLSYRLNFPSGDESTVLLTLADWDLIKGRPVPPKVGRPLVGLDMGGGRSWSAAVALWPNGRCEAFALCPGIPSIVEQEKRDLEPARHLRQARRWGTPEAVLCDRFRLAELQDCRLPCGTCQRQWDTLRD